MAAIAAQYVTIIDRSNKVIKQSSQFKDLFADAKSAYVARKAELKDKKKLREEVELQKAIKNVSLEERSVRGTSPRPGYFSRRSTDRGSDANTPTGQARQINLAEFNNELNFARHNSPTHRDPYTDSYAAQQGLVRSQTDHQIIQHHLQRPPIPHSYSQNDLDVDPHLAYGDHYPEDLVVPRDTPQQANQKELSSLVLKAKLLLEEADCAGHSAKAIITHLQKNPDTMAAVGLTLAEISKILPKLAPGALATIGKSAPAVVALLLSSEFLIAVGVAAGVTVIAIGGYKIIKRMREKSANQRGAEEEGKMDEAIDLRELEHVERWRRGVEPMMIDDTASVVSGTSVEGEYITPYAARSTGYLPRSAVSGAPSTREKFKKSSSSSKPSKDKKSAKDKTDGDKEKKKKRRSSSERHPGDDEGSTLSSSPSLSRSDASGSLRRSSSHDDAGRTVPRVKRPSPLARMFTTRD